MKAWNCFWWKYLLFPKVWVWSYSYLASADKSPSYFPCHHKLCKSSGRIYQSKVKGKNLGKNHLFRRGLDNEESLFGRYDHRKWRYHPRLVDYQSPYSQMKFPLEHLKALGSSNSFHLKWPLDHQGLGDHEILLYYRRHHFHLKIRLD